MEKNSILKKLDIKAWREKADAFFDKNYALFFAPIFVLALYMVSLFAYGVYPFGDKYTLASYDLSAQICPFIEHLFDVMQGKSTLNYSYAIVGGADVTGTFLYFFISPFSFLFLIFGDGNVEKAASIVMLCKLAVIAFAGAWFAKKVFKDIPDPVCIGVGVAYAYCGYTFVSNTYINWMDFLIYMPFCVAAFKHFVKTEKFLPFSILMACCVYTCFSIACFSMFTVFPALIVYGLLCVEKERKNKFIAYLCLSFVVTVLLSLPVLLPAFMAFISSARGGDLFENLWYGYTMSEFTGQFESFDSSYFIDIWSMSLYRKWSYILSDAAFVTLTVFWFVRKGLKDSFAKFMLIAGIMTLLPLIVDEAMNLMNMGSYMSYALRFGFLNAIYFFGGACLAIEELCKKKESLPLEASATPKAEGVEMQNDGGMVELNVQTPALKKRETSKLICTIVLIAFGVIAVLGILWLALAGGYKTVWGWFTDSSGTLSALDGFASRFAHSLGGLELIMFIFPLVAIVTALGATFLALKKVDSRIVAIVLLVVLGTQVVFYNNQLVVGNCSTNYEKVSDYQTLTAELNARDDSYFRVKDYNDEWTAPMPLAGDANSFSVFSSIIDKDNFIPLELFGYQGNGQNTFKSAHNGGKGNRSEDFGDAFLGYKYFFVYADPNAPNETVEEQLDRIERKKPYLKQVMTTDENGEKVHLQSGDYYVYENTIVFPLGYRVKDGEYRFKRENTDNNTNRRMNLSELYEFLRGEDLEDFTDKEVVNVEIATELSEYLWNKAADVEVGAGKITARVTAEAGEALFLNFVASKGYTVTVNGKKAELIDNDLKFLSVALEEGENEVVFTYSSPYVTYMACGVGVALIALLAVAFVLKKTKLMDLLAKYLSGAGIALAIAVTAFFMIFPTCVFIIKLFALFL